MAKSGAGAPANVGALALQVLALASTCTCKYLHLHCKYLRDILQCKHCKYLHMQYNTKNTTFSTDNDDAIVIQANAQADMRAIAMPL